VGVCGPTPGFPASAGTASGRGMPWVGSSKSIIARVLEGTSVLFRGAAAPRLQLARVPQCPHAMPALRGYARILPPEWRQS
jgi:hypothetical protein